MFRRFPNCRPPVRVHREFMSANLESKAKPIFNVVIAYDDFAAGKYAVDTYSRLIPDSRDDLDVRMNMWTFGLLRNSRVYATAVEETAKAHLIVIATACDDLAPAVRKWIESWVLRKGGQHATLVAILSLNDAVDRCPPVETYLRAAATSGGMEFVLEKIGETENVTVARTAILSA